MKLSVRSVYKITKKLSVFAVMVLIASSMFVRCANIGMPQGGPRDTLAPRVVNINPNNYSTNFTGKRVFIEFDEYVTLKDQQKEFYTAPFMKKRPTLTVKGRGIQVDIQDTLVENTTYSLNFGSSIADNNEGNPFHSFRYVFSTGESIDSMVMSGYTVDAYKADSLSKTYILFFSADKDSVPDYDSTVFKNKADFVARSEDNGVFIAENLKPIDYRIYAFKDDNNNLVYDPGVDRIGFLDSVYNPINMEGFDVWYDTLRKYLVADPQLYFRVFKDVQFMRQNLVSATRPLQKRIILDFNTDYPQIDSFMLEGIDSSQIIIEHLKPTNDSISLWLNVPAENLPDTIKGRITYMKHDSVNVLQPTTQDLRLVWRFIETRAEERERLKKEQERQDLINAGLEPPREPNPFKYKTEASTTLNPEKNIPLIFDFPLIEMDSSLITLAKVDEDTVVMSRRIEQDTANMRRWIISADWEEGKTYRLLIPEGALRNVAGEINDTISAKFNVMESEQFGKLSLNVVGKTPESTYILQLTDGNTGKVINEITGVKTGKYYFNYVSPGGVSILVIEDMNGNGKWDSGNLVERRQPEQAAKFILPSGEDVILAKANWELEYTINMSDLFAPMTMRRMKDRLREIDIQNYKKIQENRQKNRGRPQQNNNNNNNGMRQNTFTPDYIN